MANEAIANEAAAEYVIETTLAETLRAEEGLTVYTQLMTAITDSDHRLRRTLNTPLPARDYAMTVSCSNALTAAMEVLAKHRPVSDSAAQASPASPTPFDSFVQHR